MTRWLLLAFFCFCSTGAAANGTDPLVDFGLAKDNAWPSSEHIALMEDYGLADHATVYYKLMAEENRARPYEWVANNYLDAGYAVVLTLIIDDGVTSTVGSSESSAIPAGVPGLLQQVTTGVFDDALRDLIAAIKEDGRPVVVRPFHELDGGWYPWGIYAEGNSPALAVEAVAHVTNLFNEAGVDNVSFEINLNRRDGRGQVLGEAELFVPALSQMVDAFSVSTYNRCGTADRYAEERSFADDFRPVYERLISLTDKPINVAEVSTSGLCAPRLPWFTAMVDSIVHEFTRVEAVTFFFGEVPVGKASNAVPIIWGIPDAGERAEFRTLIEQARSLTLAPLVEPVERSLRPQPRPERAEDSVDIPDDVPQEIIRLNITTTVIITID